MLFLLGTRVYDDRRKESLKIMTDTDQRREQIQVWSLIQSSAQKNMMML